MIAALIAEASSKVPVVLVGGGVAVGGVAGWQAWVHRNAQIIYDVGKAATEVAINKYEEIVEERSKPSLPATIPTSAKAAAAPKVGLTEAERSELTTRVTLQLEQMRKNHELKAPSGLILPTKKR